MTCTVSPWENGDFTADCRALPRHGLVWGSLKNAAKRLFVPAVLAPAVLALLPLQLTSEAQEQTPSGEWRGDYAMSAYERMVADQGQRAADSPTHMRMKVYAGAPVAGRQPVREFGGGKQE